MQSAPALAWGGSNMAIYEKQGLLNEKGFCRNRSLGGDAWP